MTYPSYSKFEIAQKIDHTLLKPTLTASELEILCREAIQYQLKTVCIPPSWVKESVRLLSTSKVDTITVVGFPLGYSTSESKAFEARQAIDQGAKEIDMVINISELKSQRIDQVESDIRKVVEACNRIPLKVIIETAYLNESEKIAAALAAERAGATFVKTSTGFAMGTPVNGATLEDLVLLRKTLKPETRLKASGGIRNLASAIAFLSAGADRLGTSSGVAILEGLEAEGAY
jgi:deoxyribose-phosphate aldolase